MNQEQTVSPGGISSAQIGSPGVSAATPANLVKSIINPEYLRDMIAAAQVRLAEVESSRRAEVRESVIATAKEAGYDIYDLLGVQPPSNSGSVRKPRAAKAGDGVLYAGAVKNPDTGAIWSGRGRRPAWHARGVPVDSRINDAAGAKAQTAGSAASSSDPAMFY